MTTGKYRHTRKERAEMQEWIRRAFECDNLDEFMRILRKNGVKDEDPRFSELVKYFRDLRSGKT
jgi:hypothetical protein